MYLLYSFITLLTLVALSPYFVYQALRHRKYVYSLGQRLGYLPVSLNLDGDDSIWVHAVSVGEVLAARPLISELRHRYPRLRLFLSTTTLGGQQLARRRVTDVDDVLYFPFDWTFSVRRTLNRVKPRLFVMIETRINQRWIPSLHIISFYEIKIIRIIVAKNHLWSRRTINMYYSGTLLFQVGSTIVTNGHKFRGNMAVCPAVKALWGQFIRRYRGEWHKIAPSEALIQGVRDFWIRGLH